MEIYQQRPSIITAIWQMYIFNIFSLKRTKLQRWSFFSNNGNVFQGTIANEGFSMVLLPPDHHH